MKLIVTVDTEEDSWGNVRASHYGVKNVGALPDFQKLCDELRVKPTYLVTYPVVTDETAAAILRTLLEDGNCEVGAQCHPWNTPPFEELESKRNTMLSNLPQDLQHKKMAGLRDAIERHLKISAGSFRSGRWGYSQSVATNLAKLGYKVDSSITPFTDWTTVGGPDFSTVEPRAFRFSANDIFHESSDGELTEIPVTIGYIGGLSSDMRWCNAVQRAVQRKRFARARIAGILSKANLIRKVWLSPESSDATEMIRLARRLQSQGYRFLNLTFHSPSLRAGLTPFVRTQQAEQRFWEKLRRFFTFARDSGIEAAKLSDAMVG
jgi:peptidoglycan/xylan/chitin deacetylase (PgdA/CDA1 family)